ncbi:hypothetical protein KM043_013465 [Ampulex compressa]|nr:hypothetical protein KM043_013465 [Ampulex compressa]
MLNLYRANDMEGKKKEPKRQDRSAGSLAQYGLFEVPDSIEDIEKDYMADEDDDDFEAELAALTAGDDTGYKSRRAQRKPASDVNLDAMVAESMKDIHSDEEVSEGEDDPDLLSELKMITGDESASSVEKSTPESETSDKSKSEENDSPVEETIKQLEERLKIYEAAEQKAKRDNELGRARRFNRGIKTLHELLNHAKAGGPINEADIPPLLPSSAIAAVPEKQPESDIAIDEPPISSPVEEDSTAEVVSNKVVDDEALQLLKNRQQEYKVTAIAWKKAGNMQEALQHVKIAKQFDIVIAAVSEGETIDLSDMPPPPIGPSPSSASAAPVSSEKEENETQQQAASEIPPADPPQHSGVEDIGGALKERLEVYRRTKTAAEAEGNSSKARRYGRICKQYEDALKLYARGKAIPLDELPIPPGFPPLASSSQPAAPVTDVSSNDQQAEPEVEAEPEPKPPEDDTVGASPSRSAPAPPPRTNIGRKQNQKPTTRAEKQMMALQQRQHEFKQAALSAKKEVAKMELDAHGLNSQADESFTLISSEDCLEEAGGTDDQIYENLELQLVKQIKSCLSTRDHSKALGDVPGYNRWERLALGYTRDLDMLRVRKRDSLPPPQHHYETKTYAIVQCCTDLNDSDIEISIIRGINYSKEADTYVMFEFPYPSDNSPSDRTSTVKGSNNPEYQAVFPLSGSIDRTSRQCQRVFKRHALKCQVWSKGGFFRGDSLIGTVTVKLQPLETKCILHDSFPLMEGRKAVGGKLELKIRLRNPILTKQIEQITDRWLTIDH